MPRPKYSFFFLFFLLFFPFQMAVHADIHSDIHSDIYDQDSPIQEPQKPRILFIIPRMLAGGMEKAFINMLQILPKSAADIEVVIFQRGGPFEHFIPEWIPIIDLETAHAQRYDTVVSYAQFVDPERWIKIEAGKRIQWIHSDIAVDADSKTMKQLVALNQSIDTFVCVSSTALEQLQSLLPEIASKTLCILNIIDTSAIKRWAKRPTTLPDSWTDKTVRVVTVARLSVEKQIDLAIRAHAILDKQGVSFTWHVIGTGPEKKNLERQIAEARLQGKFILLGKRTNPYPYISHADIFALISKTEGFGLAVAEAKILHRPIILTRFLSAKEQIISEKNGLIVDATPEALASGLLRMISDPELRKKFCHELRHFEYDNSTSIEQIRGLLSLDPSHVMGE